MLEKSCRFPHLMGLYRLGRERLASAGAGFGKRVSLPSSGCRAGAVELKIGQRRKVHITRLVGLLPGRPRLGYARLKTGVCRSKS